MTITNAILLSYTTATAKNNTVYATLNLAMIENGEDKFIRVNVWGVGPGYNPKINQAVYISLLDEKDGFLSTKLNNLHFSELSEESALNKFITKITPREDWINLAKKIIARIPIENTKWIDFLKLEFSSLYDIYKLHPAAKVNHHAYEGGLLDHVYQMLVMLEALHDKVPFKTRIEVCALAILYHDYGKIIEYKDGNYTEVMFTMGHIYVGAFELQTKMLKEEFENDDIVRTIHCVLAHHRNLEYGSPVKPATGEAFLVAMVDMLSGHGVSYETTNHMEKSFSLGTNVIKFK